MQATARETSLVHQEKEMEVVEADRSERRKMVTNAQMRMGDPVHLGNSNSSSRLKEICCCKEKVERGEEESKDPQSM